MSRLRRMLDSIEPVFSKGGKLHKFEAIYEMVDTIFYSPADVTRSAPHVRDGIDLKRVMIYVFLAALPVAMLTNSDTDQEVRASYREGADGFLTKPLSDDDAREILRMCGI